MFLAIVNDVIVAGLGGRAHRPNKIAAPSPRIIFFFSRSP